jgi:hypothetical protein
MLQVHLTLHLSRRTHRPRHVYAQDHTLLGIQVLLTLIGLLLRLYHIHYVLMLRNLFRLYAELIQSVAEFTYPDWLSLLDLNQLALNLCQQDGVEWFMEFIDRFLFYFYYILFKYISYFPVVITTIFRVILNLSIIKHSKSENIYSTLIYNQYTWLDHLNEFYSCYLSRYRIQYQQY